MNPLDKLKNLRREVFVKGQEAVAQEVAAQDHIETQKLVKDGMVAAFDTITLANELAKDGDPHKRQLAELIKSSIVGAAGQATANPAPQAGREALEANPFVGSNSLESSPSSEANSPDSTPKALPEKRLPGRPRKDGQPPKQRKGN
jgi:hypothetical protein